VYSIFDCVKFPNPAVAINHEAVKNRA
jgi:hypothetical protein